MRLKSSPIWLNLIAVALISLQSLISGVNHSGPQNHLSLADFLCSGPETVLTGEEARQLNALVQILGLSADAPASPSEKDTHCPICALNQIPAILADAPFTGLASPGGPTKKSFHGVGGVSDVTGPPLGARAPPSFLF